MTAEKSAPLEPLPHCVSSVARFCLLSIPPLSLAKWHWQVLLCWHYPLTPLHTSTHSSLTRPHSCAEAVPSKLINPTCNSRADVCPESSLSWLVCSNRVPRTTIKRSLVHFLSEPILGLFPDLWLPCPWVSFIDFAHSAHHINAFVPQSCLKGSSPLPFKFSPRWPHPSHVLQRPSTLPLLPHIDLSTESHIMYTGTVGHLNLLISRPQIKLISHVPLQKSVPFPLKPTASSGITLRKVQSRTSFLNAIPVVSSFCLSMRPSSPLIHPTLPSHPNDYYSLPRCHPCPSHLPPNCISHWGQNYL